MTCVAVLLSRVRRLALSAVVAATSLTVFIIPALVQTLPDPDVLEQMVSQLNDDDAEALVSVAPSLEFQRRGKSYSAGSRTDARCGMQHFSLKLTNEKTRKSNSYSVLLDPQPDGGKTNPKEFFIVTRVIHVDADGSPRAYHPEDPTGAGTCEFQRKADGDYVARGVCALDNFTSGGVKIFNGPRKLAGSDLVQQWHAFWPQIRDRTVTSALVRANRIKLNHDYYVFHWNERKLTAFFKRGIIPSTSDGLPCTFGPNAPFPGYFVAATTLRNTIQPSDAVPIAPPECNSAAYINAERVPFIVLPSGQIGQAGVGDLIIAHARIGGEDRFVYGVVGDAGPIHQFGEASVAFIQRLLGQAGEPVMNGAALESLDIGVDKKLNVTVLILGGTKDLLHGDYTATNIERVGRQQFESWGSGSPERRLNACIAHAQVNPR
jgi:hypothetical protein